MFFLLICTFLGFINGMSAEGQLCYTPKHTYGECVNIRKCPPLWNLLQNIEKHPPDALNFLRLSQCGFEHKEPKVCCSSENNEKEKDYSGSPLLPDFETCGTVLTDKILKGTETSPKDFPWMVLLEYKLRSGITTVACGGVLINKRYILTAAHCIKPPDYTLTSVRLGEHDISTDPDCYFKHGKKICSPPVISIPIEEEIVHESFDDSDISRKDDIALLRLIKEVEYSEYVKPICLPVTPKMREESNRTKTMIVAGWGQTEYKKWSNVKLKLTVPVKSKKECLSVYKQTRVDFGDGQLCAGGEEYKDSCKGDSGGPLMSVYIDDVQANWMSSGIVSFGPSTCGMYNFPAIYTKVSHYMPWIMKNLRL